MYIYYVYSPFGVNRLLLRFSIFNGYTYSMAKKSTKRGRPRKAGGHKTAVILVRCSPETKERYQDVAYAKGLDLAEWIRRVCDAAAEQER